MNTLRLYDVYRCYVNARTGYRALPHPSERPACAEQHLGTVAATGKRDATTQVVIECRMRWKELRYLVEGT